MSVIFIDKLQLTLFVTIFMLYHKLGAHGYCALYIDYWANFLITLWYGGSRLLQICF